MLGILHFDAAAHDADRGVAARRFLDDEGRGLSARFAAIGADTEHLRIRLRPRPLPAPPRSVRQ